ncbi:DUF1971 domain-containing protein [Corticimicrobacter populi]|uniref:Ferredoxin n=1 Tax=Corticimicrobacter populi TaxID=2175229 RepID=A0A2V1JU49_9BURK|nr:DUF1971 domain-containing protein [Corticimicrobacter populi]PWF21511.1 ferredoxin [Corticimicrobacter populi]QDQ88897.1 DUF1971 domain-containing protein [Alcaligenaceae bacterium SJ-26]
MTHPRHPDLPLTLPPGVEPYGRSPDFTPDTLPTALQTDHATAAGVWGRLQVQAGRLRYQLAQSPDVSVELAAGESLIIAPEIRHRVAFIEPGQFHIEFCRLPRQGESA